MKRIALDGPAGSGKSTVAKKIAKALSIEYLDTGAMYRAVTLYAMQKRVDLESVASISEMLKQIQIDFVKGKILLNQEDVTEAIRLPEVAANVSKVASIKMIREAMVKAQQAMAERKEIVMDGRDIGTVVLPTTPYKFYLTASIEARAHRRFEEMKAKGLSVDLDQIKADIEKRDFIDMNREESPLKQANDAILVDTTGLGIEEVVACLLKHIERIAKDSNETNH